MDPGRKKREIRPREAARLGGGARHFCHLAIPGASARPRPGPARRGESPAAAAPPHALPRRPRARGRPGQVAAVPGSGRPGAAASERAAAAAPDRRPAGTSSRGACGARCPGPGSPVRVHRPLPPVRFCVIFRLNREGAARRGLPSFPPPRTTPPRLRSARRTPGGTEGPRPRCEGSRRAEGRAQRRRRGRGPAGPGRRGASRRS